MTLVPGGFIQIPRAAFTNATRHWLGKYARKKRKFSQFEACLDLVERAAFGDYRKEANGQTVVIPRGHVVASVRLYADRWCWPQTTTQRFLKRLERDGDLCTVTGTPIGTLYRLTQYELDQGDGTLNGTSNGTEAEHRRNDNKKESSKERLLEEEKSVADKPRPPRSQKPVSREETNAPTPEQPTTTGEHWLAPSAAVYEERIGKGSFNWGRAGKQLLTLRDVYPPEQIAAHLGVWLEKQLADAEQRGKRPYLNFDDLRDTFGLHAPEPEVAARSRSVAEELVASGRGNEAGQVFTIAFPVCHSARDPRIEKLTKHWRANRGAGVSAADVFSALGGLLCDYPVDTVERAIDYFLSESAAEGKPQFYTWKVFASSASQRVRAVEKHDVDNPEIGPMLAESWGPEKCAQLRAEHANLIRSPGWTDCARGLWGLAQRYGLTAHDDQGALDRAAADPEVGRPARLRIYIKKARPWELSEMAPPDAIREMAERLAYAYRENRGFDHVRDDGPAAGSDHTMPPQIAPIADVLTALSLKYELTAKSDPDSYQKRIDQAVNDPRVANADAMRAAIHAVKPWELGLVRRDALSKAINDRLTTAGAAV